MRRLRQLATRGWLLVIFGAGILYLATNYRQIAEQLQVISPVRLLLSSAFLVAGKLLLVQLSRQSVEVVGAEIGFRRMFYINSLSQLAKYLPGGVWHFVGRATYYHDDGIEVKRATQAIIVENIWLITSACFVGAMFFALYAAETSDLLLLVVLGLAWVSLLFLMTRWRVPDVQLMDVLYALVLQALIWICLGMSLWALIPVDGGATLVVLAIGAFGLSWAIGYMTLFAPSGLGVREAVLVALLVAFLAPAQSVIYATINRMVWVVTELLLGMLVKVRGGEVVVTPERDAL